jgi:hypothetical protein
MGADVYSERVGSPSRRLKQPTAPFENRLIPVQRSVPRPSFERKQSERVPIYASSIAIYAWS